MPDVASALPRLRCVAAFYKPCPAQVLTIVPLQRAGLTPDFARTVGIAIDRRRRNKSIEQRQINVQRLKEYRSKLILFPVHEKRKLRKGEATPEERKVATQLRGEVMPIRNPKPVVSVRAITDAEKKFGAFLTLKKNRSDARLVGIRAKKAKEAAENVDDPTKGAAAAATVKKAKK